jgi:hypothetical protein
MPHAGLFQSVSQTQDKIYRRHLQFGILRAGWMPSQSAGAVPAARRKQTIQNDYVIAHS